MLPRLRKAARARVPWRSPWWRPSTVSWVAATARAHAQLEEELLVARRRAAQAEAGAVHGAAAQGAAP